MLAATHAMRLGVVWITGGLLISACASTPSASAPASTQPVSAQTGAIQSGPSRPPGGPLPAQLQGDWFLVGSESSTNQHLILTATTYMTRQTNGDAHGEVVVNGEEIDFFNGDVCGLPLPGGVGRYRFTLTSGTLRLMPITPDPCGRTSILSNFNYRKL